MTLTAGTRIGPYEIVGALGAGGMGEVYRARDSRLNRDVALKVLPEAFANDRDRLARFSREAQTLAALNHSHIAHIHGVEESSGVRALVMEFVEGEDLAQRLERGPLPIDEALAIAGQITEALEAAHEQGIIHRDLKPANIKVKADGSVKVLDFGLAKAIEGGDRSSAADGQLTHSPTLTTPALMTRMGVILGTAAYMAPEQAKGKAIDKRADIWAFGVVLYEMLTGRHLFEGETVSEILAAVITTAPDLSKLPAALPEPIRVLLGRCLERDPKLRLRDIGEARLALTPGSTPVMSGAAMVPRVDRPSVGSRWPIVLAGALAATFAATSLVLWRLATTPVPQPITRYQLDLPEKTTLAVITRPSLTVSPNGSTFAFIAVNNGMARVHLRRRDEIDARPVIGTEGASEPVFSPDGSEIAFFAGGQVRKMRLDGSVTVLAPVGSDPRGLTWLADNTIVFTPDATGGLFRVAAGGGAPAALTTVDEKKGERTHRWPAGLPGSKAVLFTNGSLGSPDNYDAAIIEAVVLATGERRTILEGASSARYVPTGHLLFARGSTLFAVEFDLERLATRGSPVQVLPMVDGDSTTGASHLAISDEGTLVYTPGSASAGQQRLVWAQRNGATEILDVPIGVYADPQIAPDGTRAAITWQSTGSSGADVWIRDFVRSTFTRLSFTGSTATPVWSGDGKTVYFVYTEPNGKKSTIMRRPADGSRDAQALVSFDSRMYLMGLSADDRVALIDYSPTAGGNADLASLELKSDAKPVSIVKTSFTEYSAAWSPDRRWLAYQSDETGRFEVYVRDMNEGGGRWQVSTAGGEEPHWSRDGSELYFRNDIALMAVRVDTRQTFEPTTPVKLFEGVYNLRSDSGVSYAVDPKSDRLLMIRLVGDDGAAARIRVVTNWFDELRQLTEPRR